MVWRSMGASAAGAALAAAEAAAVDSGAVAVVVRGAGTLAGLGEGAVPDPAPLLLAAVVPGAVAGGLGGRAVLVGDDLVALGEGVAVAVDAALVGVGGAGGEGGGEEAHTAEDDRS